MKKLSNGCINNLRSLCLIGVIFLGLITIVGSGSNGGNGEDGGDGDTPLNTSPIATISSPSEGSTYTLGDTITFTGTGEDAEDGTLSGTSLVWTSSLYGEIGTGTSFTLDDLSVGAHTITLTATDSEGTTGTSSIGITVNPVGNTLPTATIISPLDGSIYTYGDMVTFAGFGDDAEDGTLIGNSLVWSSSIDAQVGTGSFVERNDLSLGDHAITLTATDGEGAAGSDVVNISVKTWTHPTGLTDNISPDGSSAAATYHQVAMDNSGNAIITWSQSDGSTDQIFKSEYRGGAWSHPTDITDNISPDGQYAWYPQVAMDDSGNAIITWQQSDGSTLQIFMSEYRGGTWSHPADLTDNISPDGQDAFYPEAAMDDNGNAIITWYQSDGTNDQIFMSEYY